MRPGIVIARAAQFQTAWTLTILCVAGAAVTAWGIYQVVRTFGQMLRDGDGLLFATCVSLVTLTTLFFGALIVMTLVSLGPPIGNGS